MKKKRMKINKKIVYSGIISLIIIINFFNFFLIIKNSKNSPDYLTGNAIYNSPLTIEQLKNGIKLNKGTNNFYWTKELEQNLVIDEALSSILNNINYIYNYNERKWWFNPSGNFARYLTNPLYKDKLFSEMKPGYKYFLNMKNEDVLNFEIASCKDSDNGIDYTNQGVVTRGSESFTDGCLNSKTVIENYCNNNEIENLDYNCNVGELCKDGKCVASKLADSNKINSCERIFDIIPSGSSLSIKDVNINVLTTNEDNFQFSAEIKVNDNNYNLNYLNNYVEININNIRYTVILITVLDSSAVIYVGICETVKMCSDSDNGKNYYIKGTLSTASEKKEDVCLDNKLLSEYYCSNQEYLYEFYECPGECKNGACVSALTIEICNDKIDNDNDGKIDCSDNDCNGDSACLVTQDSTNLLSNPSMTTDVNWLDAPEQVSILGYDGKSGWAHESKETTHKPYPTEKICYNWARSDLVPINPSKKYKFSVWVKSDDPSLYNYIGFYIYDSTKKRIPATWDNTNSWNNPYFKTSKNDINSWRKFEGFLGASSDGIATNCDSTNTNGNDWCNNDKTAYVGIRFGSCYGDGNANGLTYFMYPKIEEVS